MDARRMPANDGLRASVLTRAGAATVGAAAADGLLDAVETGEMTGALLAGCCGGDSVSAFSLVLAAVALGMAAFVVTGPTFATLTQLKQNILSNNRNLSGFLPMKREAGAAVEVVPFAAYFR